MPLIKTTETNTPEGTIIEWEFNAMNRNLKLKKKKRLKRPRTSEVLGPGRMFF